MKSLVALTALLAAFAVATPSTASARRLTAAERAQINRTLDVFVNHAVKRVHPQAAYDVVAPEMRPGMTRRSWRGGDIPVYPFPAAGHTFHGWNVLYVTRGEIGLELELIPRPHSPVGPIIFHLTLRPARERWLVSTFMPVATLAPLDAKKTKVRSVRDFSPLTQGEGAGRGGGRIDGIFALAPFAAIALLLGGLGAWGLGVAIRDRRLFGPRSGKLPPLPPRVSRRPDA